MIMQNRGEKIELLINETGSLRHDEAQDFRKKEQALGRKMWLHIYLHFTY